MSVAKVLILPVSVLVEEGGEAPAFVKATITPADEVEIRRVAAVVLGHKLSSATIPDGITDWEGFDPDTGEALAEQVPTISGCELEITGYYFFAKGIEDMVDIHVETPSLPIKVLDLVEPGEQLAYDEIQDRFRKQIEACGAEILKAY